jgi:hypothetical protein
MDSGRFLLAVVLMIAVMVITNILLPPARPDGGLAPATDTTGAPVTAPAAQPPAAELRPDPPTAAGAPAEEFVAPQLTADTVLIRSELFE